MRRKRTDCAGHSSVYFLGWLGLSTSGTNNDMVQLHAGDIGRAGAFPQGVTSVARLSRSQSGLPGEEARLLPRRVLWPTRRTDERAFT